MIMLMVALQWILWHMPSVTVTELWLVLVLVQVLVMDLTDPTSLRFGLRHFLDRTWSMCIWSVVFVYFI